MRTYRIEDEERFSRQVPEHLQNGLRLYLEEGIPPGTFLRSVLSNDLAESFARADDSSLRGMHGLVLWLYNYAPSPSWGSRERVQQWVASFRQAVA